MNTTTFADLGLIDPVLKAVSEEGYTTPTPIQAESIPALLAGRDLLGIAQTGTGKTAAFALPLIQRLIGNPKKAAPKTTRVLVVAPTRELAAQIDKSFESYGRGANLSRACVFGGVGSVPQEKALLRGVDVLVATPGRLLDLVERKHLTLGFVEAVVLDEADRMFDMGFIRDVRRIVSLLPPKRQTIFFSATMPPAIEAFADPLLTDPVRAAVASTQPTADRVEQKVLFVTKEDKRKLLTAILKEDGFKRVIVFSKTKHGANRLVKQLAAEGVTADAIHANKSQNQRTKTMEAFRNGETDVLVATDLAARGIDVDDIELVVNFDLPNEPETYVHRIGRTARAGNEGVAVSFCDAEERTLLRDIERFVGFRIPVELDHPYRLEIEPLPEKGGGKRAQPERRAQPAPRNDGQRREGRPAPKEGGRGDQSRLQAEARHGAQGEHGPYGRGRPGQERQGGRPGGRPQGAPGHAQGGYQQNRSRFHDSERQPSGPNFGSEPSIASLFSSGLNSGRAPSSGAPASRPQQGGDRSHQQRPRGRRGPGFRPSGDQR